MRKSVVHQYSLSSILGKHLMVTLEAADIQTSPLKPFLLCRYDDDIFAVRPHNAESLQEFKDHLNKQNKFTTEEESNNKKHY